VSESHCGDGYCAGDEVDSGKAGMLIRVVMAAEIGPEKTYETFERSNLGFECRYCALCGGVLRR